MNYEVKDGFLHIWIPMSQMIQVDPKRLKVVGRITRREIQVLELVNKNLCNKEIGNILNIAERTVKFYVSNLLAAANVDCRAKLRNFEFEVAETSRSVGNPLGLKKLKGLNSHRALRERRFPQARGRYGKPVKITY